MTGERVRVLFFVGQLGLGGSERQLYLLLKHLDLERFAPHVLVFNPSPHLVLNDALTAAGVPVTQMPDDCRGAWRRLRFIVQLCRRFRPHVIQSWTAHDNVYAGLVGRFVGARHLGALRGSTRLKGFQALPRVLQWLALHSVERMIVNANTLADELKARGVAPEAIVMLPNCVELPGECATTADLHDLGVTAEHRVVGLVGNLRAVKNHALFIRGLARVIRGRPDVRGVIVGQAIPAEPDYPDRLQQLIREEAMEGRIVLAGFRSDVPALLRRMDIFCLTSTSEGMPNAVLEAMAAGRPVVATRVGAIPDLVQDGVTGLLVPSEDVPAFTGAVDDLLGDPQRAAKLGAAARERVEEAFTCQHAAKRLEALYLHLAGRKPLHALTELEKGP
jgi:glycosyltransferase involved in cell wall biosynthesis